MANFILPIIYSSVAVWFYANSAMAEGFASARLLALPVFALAIIHATIATALLLLSDRRRSCGNLAPWGGVIAGCVSCLVAYNLANDLDRSKTLESQNRGDQLIEHIRAFKTQHARCPQDLGELQRAGVTIPKPAVGKSRYRFWVSRTGECTLMFRAPMFTTCRRHLQDTRWVCDD